MSVPSESEFFDAEGERTISKRSTSDSPIVLWCSFFCPFAQRSWIVLEELGVDYRYNEVNPYKVDPSAPGGFSKQPLSLEDKEKRHPGFTKVSYRGLVPALDNAGELVSNSLIVNEYANDTFKGDLLPEDPLERARCRMWSAHADDRVFKAYYQLLMDQTPQGQDKAWKEFVRSCRELADAMAPASEGPFFLGSTFSLVDIALAPFWQRVLWVGGHYRNIVLPGDDPAFQRLTVWWEAVKERPSVKATLVCKPKLIATYYQYAAGVGTSDYANSLAGTLNKTKKATTGEAAPKPTPTKDASSPAATGWVLGAVAGVVVGVAAGFGVARRWR